MRCRALVHVDGPPSAGKTAFVERLLAARVGAALCVRAHRDVGVRREVASAPKTDPELCRYLQAGACDVIHYRFRAVSMDAFYCSAAMQEYSDIVLIEGDCPVEYVDLSVFVAPPLEAGESLLHRVPTKDVPERRARASRQQLSQLFGGEDRLDQALRMMSGDTIESMLVRLTASRGSGEAVDATGMWQLHAACEGIERAQLVVLNLRAGADPIAADAFLAEVARLRRDREVFADVLGVGGKRTPVTAVAVDLSDAADQRLKKAVARVKRAIKGAER